MLADSLIFFPFPEIYRATHTSAEGCLAREYFSPKPKAHGSRSPAR
jgi:hypothetical protein